MIIFTLVLIPGTFFSCGDRVYDNPFDKDSYNYIGDENIADSNSNDTADVLEPSLVFISDTCYIMGNESNESGAQDESPVHKVCVDSFYSGETEVTVGQFQALFPEKQYIGKSNNEPISNVTWYEAVEYCNKLSSIHGLTPVYSGFDQYIKIDYSQNGFRLLNEAEWERAAGADSGELYYWGNSISLAQEYAWSLENSQEKLHKIAELKPNRLGLYDMSGNVWEWTNDWYEDKYTIVVNNPKGPISGKQKVMRGSSYKFNSSNLRVTNRNKLPPGESLQDVGFRLARTARKKTEL